MIKYIPAIVLAAISTLGFSQKKEIKISGIIENANEQLIRIDKFVANKQVTIDSCLVNKKGKFKLELEVENPEFYSIYLNKDSYALLALDNKDSEGKVIFNADANDLISTYSVQGSNTSSSISDFSKNLFNYQTTKNEKTKMMYKKGISFQDKNLIQTSIDSLDKDFVSKRNSFINANLNNISPVVAVGYLNPQTDIDILKKIEKGLSGIVPESEYHLGVKTQVAQIETQLKIQKEQEEKQKVLAAKTAIGAVAPELNFKSPEGKVITLESLRGNYVLIDFWASWCRPCRMENPNVVKMFNKYSKDGFTVYSVSLDKNPASWQKAIEQDGLIWPNHVSDLKQWQTEATKIYGFGGIPYTVLIDKEGKIVAKKLRGPALEKTLEGIFGY